MSEAAKTAEYHIGYQDGLHGRPQQWLYSADPTYLAGYAKGNWAGIMGFRQKKRSLWDIFG